MSCPLSSTPKRTSPRTGLSQPTACAGENGYGISLVIEATAQSPDSRANSTASAMRNGRRRSRSVSSLTIPHAGALCTMLDHLQVPATPVAGLLCAGFGLDGDVGAPVAFGCKLHAAVRQRKQRMVCAYADIGAGMPLGATLARQDIAGQHVLTPVLLDPEPAARRVAPVARGAPRLLVCHDDVP